MESEKRKRNIIKVAIWGSGMIMVVAIVALLINWVPKIGKIAVTLKYAPFVSTITTESRELKNNAINYLEPGEHSITVSLDNFETLNVDILVSEEGEIFYGMLEPANSEGEEMMRKDYIQDYIEIEGYYGAEQTELGEEEHEKWEIIEELPIKNALFKIGYITDEDGLSLTITAEETYIDEAVEKLKSISKDFYKYRLIVKKFVNPFKIADSLQNNSDPRAFIIDNLVADVEFEVLEGSKEGGYYYTTITTGSEEAYSLVNYRVILRKNGKTWAFASAPELVVNYYNSSDVPEEILQKANA